ESRVHEHLKRETGSACISATNGSRCGQVATGARSTDGHRVGYAAQRSSVIRRPGDGLDAIVESPRERVLRRQPVVHTDHDDPGPVGDSSTELVMHLEVA